MIRSFTLWTILASFVGTLFLSTAFVQGQTSVSLAYNHGYVCDNLSLSITRQFASHTIALGIKSQINNTQFNDPAYTFRRQFNASDEKPWQLLGLDALYTLDLPWHNAFVIPYVFAEELITYSNVRHLRFHLSGTDSTSGKELYTQRINHYGPFLASETCVGAGIRLRVSSRSFISARAGISLVGVFGSDPLLDQRTPFWDMGYTLAAGLGYRLSRDRND